MKLKELLYLVWYSIKSLFTDLLEFFSALKKAKTWSFILYATFFLGVYYRNYTVMKIALPAILLLYILRQNKEPDYNKSVRDRAFQQGDDEKIKLYYDRYKKQCYYSRKEPLSYDDYKKAEIRKLDEKKYTQSGQSDT